MLATQTWHLFLYNSFLSHNIIEIASSGAVCISTMWHKGSKVPIKMDDWVNKDCDHPEVIVRGKLIL